ncbi:MAG: DNA polymerase/3'-5' exonuclease PolX [Peptococcaceae bacterium]|nr:DNA polymerase/3'-5' exonuclease PolX [Peptococcaceae bacterium]
MEKVYFRKSLVGLLLRNVEIAWIFSELSDLMEITGLDKNKIKAYRQAAKSISAMGESVENTYYQNNLSGLPGISPKISAMVGQLIEKGEIEELELLRSQIPRGLLKVVNLPGIGPKRAALFYYNLGIEDIEDLERFARKGELRNLKGIGVKTEMEIINNIEMMLKHTEKYKLSLAKELAAELMDYLEGMSGVEKVSVVGSVRRWKDMVGDLDLLVSSPCPERILDDFIYHPLLNKVLARDNNFISCSTHWGIKVELAVVSAEEYPFSLFWKTGSRAHINELAKYTGKWEITSQGLKNEAGEMYTGTLLNSEDAIYSFFDLAYISPELREGSGEVWLAKSGHLSSIIKIEDICGDLHVHSNWSDGAASIDELVARAKDKGYQYISITDHSQSLKVAGGLNPERLKAQYRYIDELNSNSNNFKILKGVEVDILLKDGLDFDDEILEKADVVIASVHSGFNQDGDTITSRIIQAIENKQVDIIGHLTGRLLGSRRGYSLEVEKVMDAAAREGKILEINSSPDRLDLDDRNARMAVDFGVKIAVNTDSHSIKHLDEMEYGIAVARRARLRPEDVINTLNLEPLLNVFNNNKRGDKNEDKRHLSDGCKNGNEGRSKR